MIDPVRAVKPSEFFQIIKTIPQPPSPVTAAWIIPVINQVSQQLSLSREEAAAGVSRVLLLMAYIAANIEDLEELKLCARRPDGSTEISEILLLIASTVPATRDGFDQGEVIRGLSLLLNPNKPSRR